MKKTNIFKTLVLGAAFCFASFTANAQFEFGLSLTGGISTGDMKTKIPVSGALMGNSQGLMGTQYIMNSSSDMLGFAFRFGYRIPINNSEYGEVLPYVEVNGFWNRPNKDLRKQFDEANNTYPQYINVPLYIGAQYRYPVTDIIKPYAEFGIGYDLLFISSEYGKALNAGDDYRYNAKGALSGNVGVGCFFSDWVSVGIYYYGFGSHKIMLKENSEIDGLPLSDLDDRLAQYGHVNLTTLKVEYNPKPVTRDYGTVALRLNFHFGPRK